MISYLSIMNRDDMYLENNEYNDIPVHYCRRCLSLKVITVDVGDDQAFDYCDECGGTDIGTTDINDWEIQYENKYGREFATGNKI